MQVQNAVSSPATSTAASSAATVDYNSFLKLLIAELRNQDPTQPMDPTQQMAQLASFSSVEQAVQMNTKLDALITMSALSQAESAIGRTLTSSDGSVHGAIASVQIGDGGSVFATLADGRKIKLENGVTLA